MSNKPEFKKRQDNQRAKENLMVHLNNRAITSNNREYYEQALQIVNQLQPCQIVAVALSLKHTNTEIAEILGCTEKTIREYKFRVNTIIRQTFPSIPTWPGYTMAYWYMGLIDVDSFVVVTEIL